jgi:ATP-dependent RNA helicase RhlE
MQSQSRAFRPSKNQGGSSFSPKKSQNQRNNFKSYKKNEAGNPSRNSIPNKFNQRGQRPKRVPKAMDIDYSILVKKATPQAIEDYIPLSTFKEHGLHDHIIQNLDKKGYTQPTAIQDKSIPHILEKKDIIGIANTGTGKTAAFLLPLIHQVHDEPKKTILILAPTRELVSQIAYELRSFTKGTSVTSTIIMGGVGQEKQVKELRDHRNFIISTTGRGLDLMKQKRLPIHEVDTIVLDEMDQMLDMGFIRDIRQILALAVNKRHLLFFSATITKDVEKISREILNDPIFISVVKGKTSDNVNQDVVEVAPGEDKFDKLCEILSRPEVEKAIVFENTKHGCARIERDLIAKGIKSLAIHGNKNQNQRTRALNAFKNDQIKVLVATNVAARGLDIPLVSHVINYSLPESKEDYTHRIGRTGRAGEVGQALTFVPKKR